MKFTRTSKADRRMAARDRWCVWRPVFAWMPVNVGLCEFRWLERVERRATRIQEGFFTEFAPADFEYRSVR